MSTLRESVGVCSCFYNNKIITSCTAENDLLLCWTKGRTVRSDSYIGVNVKIVVGSSHADVMRNQGK